MHGFVAFKLHACAEYCSMPRPICPLLFALVRTPIIRIAICLHVLALAALVIGTLLDLGEPEQTSDVAAMGTEPLTRLGQVAGMHYR